MVAVPPSNYSRGGIFTGRMVAAAHPHLWLSVFAHPHLLLCVFVTPNVKESTASTYLIDHIADIEDHTADIKNHTNILGSSHS